MLAKRLSLRDVIFSFATVGADTSTHNKRQELEQARLQRKIDYLTGKRTTTGGGVIGKLT